VSSEWVIEVMSDQLKISVNGTIVFDSNDFDAISEE
jgi:hypothetical protein